MNSPVSLFSRILKANLLNLVIPMVITLGLAQLCIFLLEKEALKSSQATLEQIRNQMDVRLQELDSVAQQIALDPQIKSFLGLRTLEQSRQTVVDLWSLTKDLPNYTLSNTLIEKFYIYSSVLKVAVSNNEALLNNQRDFERVFQYGDWDLEKWNKFFLQTNHQRSLVTQAEMKIGGQKRKGLYYLQSLPREFRNSVPLGQVLFFLNAQVIESYLQLIDVGKTGIVLIADPQGSLVGSFSPSWDVGRQEALALALAHDQPLKIDTSAFLLSKTVSRSTGWTYLAVLPQDLVFAPILIVRNVIIGLILMTVLLSLGLTWWLSAQSARPMEKSLQNLQDALKRQVPLLQAETLRRLFAGLLVDTEEIRAQAMAAELNLEARSLLAAVLHIEGWDTLLPTKSLADVHLAKTFLRECLEKSTPLSIAMYDDDVHSLHVLIQSAHLDEAGLVQATRELLETSASELEAALHATMTWSVGSVVDQPGRLFESFQVARTAFQPMGPSPLTYPLETEMRLVGAVKKGDRPTTLKVLEQIARENLIDRTLSPQNFSALASALYASVVRALPAELPRSLATDLSHEDPKVWFDWFQQQLVQICAAILEAKSEGVSARLQEINAHILANLGDPGLTLFSVAQQFGMTEPFFYHFYRNHSGVSFADYLERIRIEKACRLLSDERLKVGQVIVKTGFTSPTTFRRAFRRVLSISPSDFVSSLTSHNS